MLNFQIQYGHQFSNHVLSSGYSFSFFCYHLVVTIYRGNQTTFNISQLNVENNLEYEECDVCPSSLLIP